MRYAIALLAGGFALPVAWYALGAADTGIDGARSTLVVTYRQENVPVDAPFKRFSGHISYDPAQPASARASLEVITGSLDLGAEDYNAEVRKKDWLDSGTYATATFSSTAIRPGMPGHFDATGTLTLKGRTQTLTVPVVVGKAGSATSFDGELAISRAYFGIGSADWNDVLDDKVRIRFHIVE
jgi:polyisoprenoid-binding protein YceI